MAQKRSEWVWALRTSLVGMLVMLAVLLVLPLALAPRAQAFIYWTAGANDSGSMVGRANLDGTRVDPSFVNGLPGFSTGLAVDAEHIYWTHYDNEADIKSGAIGRAKLDGSDVHQSFISGVNAPQGVAVGGGHVYWADFDAQTIGRANLDGTGVDQSFIATDNKPFDVAVNASHIYWTNFGANTIGRANLDGTGVEMSLISGGFGPAGSQFRGVAVDAEHVYWTGQVCSVVGSGTCGPAIMRADLDGTDVDRTLITGGAGFHSSSWLDVAVAADFVYWTEGNFGGTGTIGRASLDGTGAGTFITEGELGNPDTGGVPYDLAVDALTDTKLAGRASAAKTQKQQGKKIVVEVKVKAKERLTAKAGGKIDVNPTYRLKPRTVQAAAGKTKTLKLKLRKHAQAERIAGALKRGKKATAKLTVKLSDPAGNTKTQTMRVRLKRD